MEEDGRCWSEQIGVKGLKIWPHNEGEDTDGKPQWVEIEIFLFYPVHFSVRAIFSLQTQECKHVPCAIWAMNKRIWALRKGAGMGEACVLCLHPHSNLSNKQHSSYTPNVQRTNQVPVSQNSIFLPPANSFPYGIDWNKVFDECG